ncbi:hypothetical protein CV650_05215 [Borreliella burgdorferi]|nr:hypothetical protein CV649_05250 [Borreliella burgdorferi]PRR19507.1 hypothetical protein CV647_05045 [Borreliella burgdorferi]PRR23141.1 hypothetical protein CV646_05215 [Borreliella burgdorferi]PRR53362.1 hypothetical protein CV650_05215 [Borreliella burgdorferi]PRR53645.1 hypothetical protein CV653_05220 [Borreliella burgdorferi]
MFLYTLLTIGLISCNLDSKLPNKEQKNNNDIKETLGSSVQENALNNLYGNQEEKKDFKNFEELKDESLIAPAKSLASTRPTTVGNIESAVLPVGHVVSLETSANKVSIPTISIKHNQKKEIKKEDLSPSTKEEKKADKAIKDIENLIRDSGFPELIESMYSLKHEYTLIRNNFYDVITKIRNKKTSLIKNGRNNRDKIKELTQLQNNLKIADELDEIMVHIDIAEQEIRSAAFFFNEAKEILKEGIIKRLESENKVASQLARQALNKVEDALKSLEASSSKRGLAMGRRRIIKELIENAKTVLSKS